MLHLANLLSEGEGGHAPTLVGVLIGGVGAVLLGIGAAMDDAGALAVIGGIVLAVGLLAESVISHMAVDYDVFRRLDKLEK